MPGCHAEADFSEPSGRDQSGRPAATLYLCSEHYMARLTDPSSAPADRLTDGTPDWTNGPSENGQDPGR